MHIWDSRTEVNRLAAAAVTDRIPKLSHFFLINVA